MLVSQEKILLLLSIIAFLFGLYILFRVGVFRSLLSLVGWVLTLGSIVFVWAFNILSQQDLPYNKTLPEGKRGAAVQVAPQCIRRIECTLIRVLYGTTRDIDYDVKAEQDGDFIDDDETPFLDRLNPDSALTLGYIDITVPKRARADNNKLFRPDRRNRLQRRLGLGARLDGAKHYIFRDYDELDEAEFGVALAGQKRAFVYIHGYQESLITAAFRAAQIKAVGDFDGQALIFSWPSIKGISADNYFKAQDNAANSAEALKDFLRLLSRELSTPELHVIAHSMGNFALLNALKHAADAPPEEGGIALDQIMMAAPDVSSVEFKSLISELRANSRGATMYASRSDVALRASRRACEGRRKMLEDKSPNLTEEETAQLGRLTCDNRAGFVAPPPRDIPLIEIGVDSIDASNVDANTWFGGIPGLHGYAFEDPAVFRDLGQVMDRVRRYPVHRRGQLICVNDEGDYCEDQSNPPERRFWRFY